MENMFEIGDKVQWTEKRVSGRTISMNMRRGTIVERFGDDYLVKKTNGQNQVVPASWLQLDGQKSEIQDFIEAMRLASKK